MSSRASSDEYESRTGVDRRSFIKSALLVGGSAGLSSLTSLLDASGTAAATDTSVTVAERENRQHAWNDYSASLHGTTVPPEYTLILSVDLTEDAVEDGTPTADARDEVAAALDSLEDTFGWGSDGLLFTIGYSPAYFDRFDETLPGKLSDRTSALGLIDPDVTVDVTAAPHEDPSEIAAEDADAVLHLASDDPVTLLQAELALWDGDGDDGDYDYDLDKQGSGSSVSVPDLEGSFEDVFHQPTSPPGRRVSYVGHDTLVEEFEEALSGTEFEGVEEEIPEESDLSMGVNVLFKNSNPPEPLATLTEDGQLAGTPQEPGMFAQGTIQHLSKLDIALDDWYGNNDLDERREQLLSPDHTEANTGVAGEELGESTATDTALRDADGEGLAERVVQDAEEEGLVGHAQKIARARAPMESRQTGDDGAERRDDLRGHDGVQELEPPILRRDAPTADTGRPGLNFVSLMRFNGYMHYIRQAMNGGAFDTAAFGVDGDARLDHESVVETVDGENSEGNNDNGIVPYLETTRRGNFLVPPITVRALPPARAARPTTGVNGSDVVGDQEYHLVAVDFSTVDAGPDEIEADDLRNVRFGVSHLVNRGGGVEPVYAEADDGVAVFVFPDDGAGLDDTAVDADGYDDDGDADGVVTARLFAETEDGYPVRATAECEVVDTPTETVEDVDDFELDPESVQFEDGGFVVVSDDDDDDDDHDDDDDGRPAHAGRGGGPPAHAGRGGDDDDEDLCVIRPLSSRLPPRRGSRPSTTDCDALAQRHQHRLEGRERADVPEVRRHAAGRRRRVRPRLAVDECRQRLGVDGAGGGRVVGDDDRLPREAGPGRGERLAVALLLVVDEHQVEVVVLLGDGDGVALPDRDAVRQSAAVEVLASVGQQLGVAIDDHHLAVVGERAGHPVRRVAEARPELVHTARAGESDQPGEQAADLGADGGKALAVGAVVHLADHVVGRRADRAGEPRDRRRWLRVDHTPASPPTVFGLRDGDPGSVFFAAPPND